MKLKFGDVDFCDYNAYVFPSEVLTTPSIKHEKVDVAGRNGSLYFSKDSYANVPVEYTVIIMNCFNHAYDEIKDKLATTVGYQRIEDSRRPDEYRLGYLESDIIPVTKNNFRHGKFRLTLLCKPQHFKVSGERWYSFGDTSNISIFNPTRHPALPVLRIYGNGTVNAGEGIVTVQGSTYPYIDVDCETMNATYNGVNANQYVSFPTNVPPVINSGINAILVTGADSLDVMPRWWTL